MITLKGLLTTLILVCPLLGAGVAYFTPLHLHDQATPLVLLLFLTGLLAACGYVLHLLVDHFSDRRVEITKPRSDV